MEEAGSVGPGRTPESEQAKPPAVSLLPGDEQGVQSLGLVLLLITNLLYSKG